VEVALRRTSRSCEASPRRTPTSLSRYVIGRRDCEYEYNPEVISCVFCDRPATWVGWRVSPDERAFIVQHPDHLECTTDPNDGRVKAMIARVQEAVEK